MVFEVLVPTVEVVSRSPRPLMLSDFSTQRDRYGIPILAGYKLAIWEGDSPACRAYIERWNSRYEIFKVIVLRLTTVLKDIDFVEEWLVRSLGAYGRRTFSQRLPRGEPRCRDLFAHGSFELAATTQSRYR
jgi:hypothetical protein